VPFTVSWLAASLWAAFVIAIAVAASAASAWPAPAADRLAGTGLHLKPEEETMRRNLAITVAVVAAIAIIRGHSGMADGHPGS